MDTDGSLNVLRTELYGGTSHLGTYMGGTFYYAHTNWLGTETARTDASGSICQTTSSLPFGDNPQSSGTCSPSPNFFTGKERDAESGNDYFGARYYASTMGRWLSPDWSPTPTAVPYADLMNPQSLNLYEYGSNNPLARADQDGHCPICVAIVAVAVGVAIYKGYKAWKQFEKSAKKAADTNNHLYVNMVNGDQEQTVQQYQQDNAQAMRDGANAAVDLVGAANAVQTAGEAAADGAAESLTNPANAADTMKDSAVEAIQTVNEVQQKQTETQKPSDLPDAPKPQNQNQNQPAPPPTPPPPPPKQPQQQ